MVNIINGVKQYTNYRKDFTPEEKAAYNAYVVSRMQVFRKTEHGREVINANNKLAYYRRKERLGIESRPVGRPRKEQNQPLGNNF